MKEIHINGQDFTSFFARTGYTVEYIKRVGYNAGMMQDGKTEEDLIARKAEITLPIYPLTDEQESELLTAAFSEQYPLVEYYDPRTGDYRLIECIVNTDRIQYKGIGGDGSEYWSGRSIAFLER